MPLLGRYKSHGAGQSPPSSATRRTQASQAPAPSTSTSASPTEPQLCKSPLFGVRRQLEIGQQHDKDSGSIPQQITRQQIHYAFSIMDTNSDGLIDLRDLSQMLANLGVPIDEAILSHVMSTVSKRGDHRIGEAEFLEWISHLIQVSEGGAASASTGASPRAAAKTRAARSVTSGAGSLVAGQPSAELLRNRRGSGSGLALMRSLSSGSSAMGAQSATHERPATCSSESRVDQLADERLSRSLNRTTTSTASNSSSETSLRYSQDEETRNDLRAAFCVFDLDGDGFITLDEVRAGLKLLGESWSPAELSQLFARCSSARPTAGSSRLRPGAGSSLRPPSIADRISIDDFVQLLM